jgi:hypothetical protein
MPSAKKEDGDWRQFLANTGVDDHPLQACSSWEYADMSSSVYAASTSAHDEARSKCLPEYELTLDMETSSLDEILTLDDWIVYFSTIWSCGKSQFGITSRRWYKDVADQPQY